MSSHNVSHIECSRCGKRLEPHRVYNLCECGGPLLIRYWLGPATMPRDAVKMRAKTLWRYREVLPLQAEASAVSLGEGFTPLLHAVRLGERLGLPHLYLKDEGANPTGSFKARGQSVAISMAHELGVRKVAIPSAGNAGGAMAAYAARAGLEALVFMPEGTPVMNRLECSILGAEVRLIAGSIKDCGRALGERIRAEGWFDLSTLKEPYRVEGKKTMAYEVVEQLDGRVPEVMIYPTGGGTGLVGMWKAFAEMEQLGWTTGRRPRMVAVQATGCAPMVRAFRRGAERAEEWIDPATMASGLRVPSAVGDALILSALRESGGTAVAVDDGAMLRAVREIAQAEGVVTSPEGGATLAALELLRDQGLVSPPESVVLFLTGSGYKYLEAMEAVAQGSVVPATRVAPPGS
ncbi:MAG TPA: threonine synthase [Terriglobia bacterium]|nr:threonine synthase [Terriglobia bacterium]